MPPNGRRSGGAACGELRAVLPVGAGIATAGADGGVMPTGAECRGAGERSMSRTPGGAATAGATVGAEATGAADAGVTDGRAGPSAGASTSNATIDVGAKCNAGLGRERGDPWDVEAGRLGAGGDGAASSGCEGCCTSFDGAYALVGDGDGDSSMIGTGAGASTVTSGAATTGVRSTFTCSVAVVGVTTVTSGSGIGRSIASGGCTGKSVFAYAVPAYPRAATTTAASVISRLLT
jgi:hypothetical protein